MTEAQMLTELVAYFEHNDGWSIENDARGHILAVMSSGYGSGPAVIDLTGLVKHLTGGGRDVDSKT